MEEVTCLSEDGVLDFVEGRLSSEDAARMERHLAGCPACGGLVAAVAKAWVREGKIAAPAGPSASSSGERLQRGARIGRFEVDALIGAGGMGEVYRARDTRLGRDVALKVLPPALAADADRVRRFEQEARAAGILNHPNVLAIHDVGTHEAEGAGAARVPYIVSELLSGQTLRRALAGGAFPRARAIDVALQIARGLAAAHEKGIVHRDLKPENVFVCKDGLVKILDFGLAKLAAGWPRSPDEAQTPSLGSERGETTPGAILGTVGYMAPEQARGEPADHRADLFALGAILHEMVSGRRAFGGASPVERLTAILKDEPPALPDPALDRVARHCLAKDRRERVQSARDLAVLLEALAAAGAAPPATTIATLASPSESGAQGAVSGAGEGAVARLGKGRARVVAVVAAALGVVAIAASAGRRAAHRSPGTSPAATATGEAGAAAAAGATSPAPEAPIYHQFTFRYGRVLSARFSPDGHTVVYGASWEGGPPALFTTRVERIDAQPFDLPPADVLSISSRGEVAISLGRTNHDAFATTGTLARVPLLGGTPRVVLEGVQEADFTRVGDGLAVVRAVGGRYRVELPIGHVLHASAGWLSHARVSPDGARVAFLEHPSPEDDRGDVMVVDTVAGVPPEPRALSRGWASLQGLAWAPSGDEVWFTAARAGGNNAVVAATLDGRERLVARSAGRLVLEDVSREGRALVAHEAARLRMMARLGEGAKERELSWSDVSVISDLSADGGTVLFAEVGETEGESYATYLRKADGAPPIRLGDGLPLSLSPDGRWALSMLFGEPTRLVLLPTAAGEPRVLSSEGIASTTWARFLPDGAEILRAGRDPAGKARLWRQPVDGGAPQLLDLAFGAPGALSPEGDRVAGIDAAGRLRVVRLDGGGEREVPGDYSGRTVAQWSADGAAVYLRQGGAPIRIARVDLASGREEAWKPILPADMVGFMGITGFAMTPDGKAYAYTYAQVLSRLYLVDGMR